MEEIWKDIKGYEGLYQVSNTGRVKALLRYDSRGNLRVERILKPIPTKNGSHLRKILITVRHYIDDQLHNVKLKIVIALLQ